MSELAALPPDLASSLAASGAVRADLGSAADEADTPPRRLHGLSAERQAAARLRAALIAHCGGRPSATQACMIEQAAELKLRLAVMDRAFIRTQHRSAHASRDYLAWSNSLVRLLAQLGLKAASEPPGAALARHRAKLAAEAEAEAAAAARQAVGQAPAGASAGRRQPPDTEPPSTGFLAASRGEAS